jgi:XRE family transcriptional regulator, regulator of sulfur utilization
MPSLDKWTIVHYTKHHENGHSSIIEIILELHMDSLQITTNLLAQAVRAHRESRGFSIGTLAEKAGISKTSLSKIEAGQGNPSLDLLCRIASALNVPVGTLFGEESRPQLQIIRRDEGQVITSESGLAIRSLLVEGRNHRTEIYELLLSTPITYHSLAHMPGTLEFVFCIAGDLFLGPEGQEVHLQQGDAVWFSADLPHSYTSTSGARAFLVMKYPPAQGVLP